MDRRSFIFVAASALAARPALALEPGAEFRFASIDGGELRLTAFRGGPVLVVNTASCCMS